MRKIILLLFISFTFQSTYSQVWIDNGATWHYQTWQPLLNGYIEIIYDRDTIIDGISCQVIESELSQFYDGGGTFETVSLALQMTYVSGDTVFYRNNDNFYVLFDFGAEVGDTWLISELPSEMYDGCDENSVIQVMGVGNVDIGGETYRYLDLKPTANSPFGFEGRYVERFGLMSGGSEQFRHLFPWMYGCEGIPEDVPTEFLYAGFLCFEDDSFELYNPSGESCIEVSSLPEELQGAQVNCYPNPASNYLEISADKQIENLNIYSSVGVLVMSVDISQNATQIDISMLSRGIYFFNIQLENGLIVQRKVVLK